MLMRKLTRTDRGEFILRLPKAILSPLMIKDCHVTLERQGKRLIIGAILMRLGDKPACRGLDNRRHSVRSKTTL